MSLYSAQFISNNMKRLRYLRFFVSMLLLFTLHACGFQLRGAMDLSQDVSPVYLQQNTAFELGREIKSILVTNKIAIAEYANTANSRLTIVKENKAQRVLSVDSSGRAKEYLITYTVIYTIKIKQQEATDESVVISRSLLFDTEAVLAVTNQAEVLYKDMKRDAARLILQKLQARTRNAAAAEQIDKPADDNAAVPK
jgi:LPS-assembly lipoprotein